MLDKRGKAADDKTGKASNEDPKIAVLDNIKQDLKADEVGDLIDSELATIVTSLLTKGMVDDKLQEKINRTAQPQNCEALTKVKVNQLIWDTLTLSLLKRPKAAREYDYFSLSDPSLEIVLLSCIVLHLLKEILTNQIHPTAHMICVPVWSAERPKFVHCFGV